jgi:hypothetical protein
MELKLASDWTRESHEYQGEYGSYQSECLISPDGKLKIALEEPGYIYDYNLLENCYEEVEQLIIHEPYLSHYAPANENVCGIADWADQLYKYAPAGVTLHALTKHCERNGLTVITRGWRGYSQGDWLDYALIAKADEYHTPDNLIAIAREYESYLSGDVYEAIIYELHTVKDENTGETWDEWQEPDGGGITDVTYTMPYWNIPTATILHDVARWI